MAKEYSVHQKLKNRLQRFQVDSQKKCVRLKAEELVDQIQSSHFYAPSLHSRNNSVCLPPINSGKSPKNESQTARNASASRVTLKQASVSSIHESIRDTIRSDSDKGEEDKNKQSHKKSPAKRKDHSLSVNTYGETVPNTPAQHTAKKVVIPGAYSPQELSPRGEGKNFYAAVTHSSVVDVSPDMAKNNSPENQVRSVRLKQHKISPYIEHKFSKKRKAEAAQGKILVSVGQYLQRARENDDKALYPDDFETLDGDKAKEQQIEEEIIQRVN